MKLSLRLRLLDESIDDLSSSLEAPPPIIFSGKFASTTDPRDFSSAPTDFPGDSTSWYTTMVSLTTSDLF
ncbi:unnamed protein product [Cochlearia groenlandica]